MKLSRVILMCGVLFSQGAHAQNQEQSFAWQRGPGTGLIDGKATISIPKDYVFLDAAETKKFLEATHNLGDGSSYFFAPTSDQFEAYFTFSPEGYVRDDETLDPDALLKVLKQQQQAANVERQKRGWPAFNLDGWYISPRYNPSTKVLEWATKISEEGTGKVSINYYTKVLGRRGITSAQVVVDPAGAEQGIALFQEKLSGFQYVQNEKYADYQPGDHVAEYGLAALVTGGVAAVAAKKGFFAVIAAFLAGAWKLLIAALVGVGAWVKSLFGKKKTGSQ